MTTRTLEYRRLDDIVRAEANAKGHDVAGIAASIERFGFGGALEIDERTGRLVSGHGRLDDLSVKHAAGVDAPDGIEVDDDGMWLAPLIRGWASVDDAEAEAYAVAVNALPIAGGWEPETLLEQLERIQSTPLGLEGVGFTSDELAMMQAEFAPSSLPELTSGDSMPAAPEWDDAGVGDDSTVAFRFGDYSGKVQRTVYDGFVAQYERLRTEEDVVMLDEALVRWLAIPAVAS